MSGTVYGDYSDNGKEYYILLTGKVTANVFFDVDEKDYSWGKIQKDLLSIEEGITIYVDIALVTWMDIMAILYFLLDLKKVSSKCAIEFMYLDAENDLEKARFHLFLLENGYFDIVGSIVNQNIEELVNLSRIEMNKKYIKDTTFDFCPAIIPITLIKNSEQVDDVLEDIYQVLKKQGGEYSNDLNKIVSILDSIISECVDNVFEHAFDNGEGCCLIYLRELHYGKIVDKNIWKYKSADTTEKRRKLLYTLDEKINREDTRFSSYVQEMFVENNKYSNPDENIEHRDILQLFVVDNGKGIAKSFGSKERGEDRNLIDGILSDGKRSKNKIGNTTGGGLSMINHLLEEENDFISVKGDYTWVRHVCVKDKTNDNPDNSYITRKGKHDNNPSYGTAFVFEIKKKENNLQTIFREIEKRKQLPTKIYDKHFREEYRNLIHSSYEDKDFSCCDCRYFEGNINVLANKRAEKILLVRKNTRKNQLIDYIKKMYDYESDTLIIGEIPDNEWKKYHFIISTLSQSYFKKIVTFTELMKCGVYEKSSYNNGYYFDEKRTAELVNNDKRGVPISENCYSYSLWLKWNDSREIWKLINENAYLVGKDIYWGENLIIDGYLDFFQMKTSEVVMRMFIQQMIRMVSFEANIKFVSIDKMTQDLCNEANRLIPNLGGHRDKSIGIGSVFVTGDTLEDSGLEEYVYIFKHESAPIDALALFDWCNERDGIIREKEDYYRVGRSPFISIKGDNYFRENHYKYYKSNYSVLPKPLYALLQSYSARRNSLSFFGHINMIDRHDMIHFDYSDIFRGERNWHYSVKYDEVNYNIWDYVLCEMAYSIVKEIKEDTFDAGTVALNEKFNKKVKQYAETKEGTLLGGLVIYPTDYQTKEIVESVKKVFNKEYSDRIIPISPLIRNRPSSSFLISPLYLERMKKIVEKYKENDSLQVTIFAAEGISTRQQAELEHIMFVLGATTVRAVYIVDRMRMPLGVDSGEKKRAFGRLDLPAARNKNACIMCKGKNVIERYKDGLISNKLNSTARNLLSKFGIEDQTEWNNNRGILAKKITLPPKIVTRINKICKAYDIDNIVIETDIGLVLFSVESTVISLSSGFLLECVENDEIDNDIKIMLLCAQLFHFTEQELTRTIQDKCITYLFDCCIKKGRNSESDDYLALGIIVLLSMVEEKKQLFERLMKKVIESGIYLENVSLFLFLAFIIIYDCVKCEIKSNELEGWLSKANEGILDVMYGIILHTQSDYEHTHSNTSFRIYTDAITANQRIEPLLLEIQYLQNKYDYIKERYIKNNDNVEKIISILKEEEKIIYEYQENNIEPEVFNSEIKSRSVDMIDKASELNEKYFICKVRESEKFEQRLRNIANRVIEEKHIGSNGPITNIRIAVFPSTGDDNRMFYFNRDIETEIGYLMTDFRHASDYNMIDDSIKIKVTCDGLVKVHFENDGVVISFYNLIDGSGNMDYIRKRKKEKICRPSHLIFEQINKILPNNIDNPKYGIENGENNEKVFVATIMLPYIEL